MSVLTRRPPGVTLISVLGFAGAALSVVGGIALSGATDVDARLAAPTDFVAVHAATSVFLLIVGAAQGVFSWGLWRLRSWAWVLGVAVQSAGLLGAIGAGAIGVVSPGRASLAVAIHAIVVAYLIVPEVRRAFSTR